MYDEVVLPQVEIPEGYAFDGWYVGTIVDGERVYNTDTKYESNFSIIRFFINLFDITPPA